MPKQQIVIEDPWKKLDKIELYTGIVVVSDPCYKLNTCIEGMGILKNVETGTWFPEILRPILGDWGKRVVELSLRHEDYPTLDGLDKIKLPFEVWVDSGQAGIFDLLSYQNDSLVDRKSDSEYHTAWYLECCDQTLSDELAGTLKGGVVSSTGFGDGVYAAYAYLKPSDVSEKIVVEQQYIKEGNVSYLCYEPSRPIVGFLLDYNDVEEIEEQEEEQERWEEDY